MIFVAPVQILRRTNNDSGPKSKRLESGVSSLASHSASSTPSISDAFSDSPVGSLGNDARKNSSPTFAKGKKKPAHSSPAASNLPVPLSGVSSAVSEKSLAEKDAEYDAVRLRIFGTAEVEGNDDESFPTTELPKTASNFRRSEIAILDNPVLVRRNDPEYNRNLPSADYRRNVSGQTYVNFSPEYSYQNMTGVRPSDYSVPLHGTPYGFSGMPAALELSPAEAVGKSNTFQQLQAQHAMQQQHLTANAHRNSSQPLQTRNFYNNQFAPPNMLRTLPPPFGLQGTQFQQHQQTNQTNNRYPSSRSASSASTTSVSSDSLMYSFNPQQSPMQQFYPDQQPFAHPQHFQSNITQPVVDLSSHNQFPGLSSVANTPSKKSNKQSKKQSKADIRKSDN
ncbi:hypothetical protein HDU83_002854 [Entophlyctis luteolus]|nr:hypothetical protein HDU83_002854 [Entophlyctis luteolus]